MTPQKLWLHFKFTLHYHKNVKQAKYDVNNRSPSTCNLIKVFMTEGGHSESKMKGYKEVLSEHKPLQMFTNLANWLRQRNPYPFQKPQSTEAGNFVNLLAFIYTFYFNRIAGKIYT